MTELNCPLSDIRMKPQVEPPLLTIFVPTWNRTAEMVQTIENLAGQLHGGLERKVEILISDNCSNATGQAAVRALADRFDTVSYMINAADQGGHFQVYAAPWRARGVWTWVFGSDDLLEPGAIADVVRHLEVQDPGFVTMDKSIWNRDLTKRFYASTNAIPERAFDGFIDLFKGVGLHQVVHLSVSLEKTEAGRGIDPHPYVTADTLHSYAIAFFEKHQRSKCLYIAAPHVIRRLDNVVIADYLGATFEDMGMKFPLMLLSLARQFGVTEAMFEQVNGSRRIDSYDPPKITLVDNIFEYTLRGVSEGRPISFFQKPAFETLCESWRPGRRAQFDELWRISQSMRRAIEEMNIHRERYEKRVIQIAAKRQKLHDMSRKFTDRKPNAG